MALQVAGGLGAGAIGTHQIPLYARYLGLEVIGGLVNLKPHLAGIVFNPQAVIVHPAFDRSRRVLCKAVVEAMVWAVPVVLGREFVDAHLARQHLRIAVHQIRAFPNPCVIRWVHHGLGVLALFVKLRREPRVIPP